MYTAVTVLLTAELVARGALESATEVNFIHQYDVNVVIQMGEACGEGKTVMTVGIFLFTFLYPSRIINCPHVDLFSWYLDLIGID